MPPAPVAQPGAPAPYSPYAPPSAPQGPATLPYAPNANSVTPTMAVRGLIKRFDANNFVLSIPHLDIFPGELTYVGGPSGS
ncbi:MAG: hypothetical protein ACRDHE_02510, partial [Ktedonobacterales bacterium]